MNSLNANIPVCIGMLGIDNTKIGSSSHKSFGGAALHFCAASAVIGIPFRIISYSKKENWQDVFSLLKNNTVNLDLIANSESDIEFYLEYDKDLKFISENFNEILPLNPPSLVEIIEQTIVKGQFVHICPTTPEDDEKYLIEVLKKECEISMQMHIFNLAKNIEFYRSILKNLSYVFMNEQEALILSNKNSLVESISYLRNATNAVIYITSSRGVIALSPSNNYECSSISIQPIDPTGAGDAFAGGCTAARLLTNRQDVALRMGTICAATKLRDLSSRNLLKLLDNQFISNLI
jgi:sugar/nucleoside kinase (ribokinase family)